MDLENIKSIHMIGIKGTGMSALALLLARLGIKVTGSDTPNSFFLIKEHNYSDAGITIYPDFNPNNIPSNVDLVIVASSHNSADNPEVKAMQHTKAKPLYTYGEFLGLLTREIPTIAIVGTHGKTTTTNLLAHTLLSNNKSIITIAGPTNQQNLDAMHTVKDPRYFILEADEYQNKLQYYYPKGVIMTNVELDHPDYFKTDDQYFKVFIDFVTRIPEDGFLIYCADDKGAVRVARHATCKTFPYSLNENSQLLNITTYANIFNNSKSTLPSSLLGDHNKLNALGVALASKQLGLTDKQIKQGLATFQGSDRRMQKISDSPLIYDDYGHHPTEIKAVLSTLRQKYPNKEIWTIFQAHTYTRTARFLVEFGQAFKHSDHTIVLDIWGSAREDNGQVHARDIVDLIEKNRGRAYYLSTREEASTYVKKFASKDALILTIGASDIYKIHELLKN